MHLVHLPTLSTLIDASIVSQIKLAGEGVHVAVQNSTAGAVTLNSAVVQDPFTLALHVDVPAVLNPASGEPLTRFTITRYQKLGVTAIGYSRWHPVGERHLHMLYVHQYSS